LYLIPDEFGSYATADLTSAAAVQIETISSADFFRLYELKFNVLIVDCEGCLEKFLIDNMEYLHNLELIIFEKDNPEHCNYYNIYCILKKNNFIKYDSIILGGDLDGFQQVWIKKKLE
jgi:hypothetical protein